MLGFDLVGLAHYRLTVGYVDGYFNYFKVGVYMKKLTVEKAKELIDQFCQNGCSCKEEYYLQALEAFVDNEEISSETPYQVVGSKISFNIEKGLS